MKKSKICISAALALAGFAVFSVLIGCAPKEEDAKGEEAAEYSPRYSSATSGGQTGEDAQEEPVVPVIPSDKSGEPVSLGRGINIGNALEAPKDISWGIEMKREYFNIIKDAGFDTARLPVRFSDYTSGESHELDEEFMQRLDAYIGYALEIGLNVILDFHHFVEIMQDPNGQRDKFIRIWEQVSKRYAEYPDELVFELLNEPTDKLCGETLNSLMSEAVSVIRQTNPSRILIIGPEQFNSVGGLESLKLPPDDNIIVTFHYYEPSEFSFQGNIYHEGYEHLKDIKWVASAEELKKLKDDFTRVAVWADKNNVRVFLGEFGVVKTVPPEYRNAWIETVADTAEEMGFSWAYWELCSHFGIYDENINAWDGDVLDALLN